MAGSLQYRKAAYQSWVSPASTGSNPDSWDNNELSKLNSKSGIKNGVWSTIVFVTFIVAVVMMVIGNNLARAFALVGALSIIRFRTVIKDTKDTAYIFLGLAAGMAAGTSSYFLAVAGVGFFSVIALALNATNYGSFYKSEFILRFRAPTGEGEPEYSSIINEFARSSNLLHVEPSGDGKTVKLTFDILLQKEKGPQELSTRIAEVKSVSEVVLVASKHDVDY